jgi:large subunit ribosomal protein L18
VCLLISTSANQIIIKLKSRQYREKNKNKMITKLNARQNRRYAIRKKVSGTGTKPRLSIFRSNTEIYAQLINDEGGVTLAAASSKQKDIAAQKVTKTEKSKMVGADIARKAIELGLSSVVFDRGGNLYHGRVKAVADGAREGGLQF